MPLNPMERGRLGQVLGRELTPLVQQLAGRLELASNLSRADELAIETALQKAFVTGARIASDGTEPVREWELPWGDQWSNQHREDGE